MRFSPPRRRSRTGKNLPNSAISVPELSRRIERLEAVQQDSDLFDIPAQFERVMKKLSPSDRELLDDARSRLTHPDCPDDLKAVWDRYDAAFYEAREEGPMLLSDPSDWWL